MRVYDCENCDWIADRDYSASLNLLGLVRPDVMPGSTKTSVAPLMKQELKLAWSKWMTKFIQFCPIMSNFQITVLAGCAESFSLENKSALQISLNKDCKMITFFALLINY